MATKNLQPVRGRVLLEVSGVGFRKRRPQEKVLPRRPGPDVDPRGDFDCARSQQRQAAGVGATDLHRNRRGVCQRL